jgi:hypothetical protein
MKKTRFTDTQIIAILKEADAGMKVREICKRIYRVYRGLGLNLPRRTKRRVPLREPVALGVPPRPSQVWSADFMSDALY